ncbi:MAG: ORF6N domain-containing protein [Treponema sp.]|jgi:phage regulator Rha-like protein|nr:ORF6N domain-containing protein [Treponema sp.]
MAKELSIKGTPQIQKRIHTIRGKKVMLDSDLAELYEVEVKQLNQAVKRNARRFPDDFMFSLTKDEFTEVVTNCDHLQNLKFRPTLPFAFTEQGVAMLAAVLNSQKAIDANIQIMRAFVKMRHYIIPKSDKNAQIAELRKLLMLHIESSDRKFSEQDKLNKQIALVLNSLIEQPPKTKRIGFNVD